MHIAAKNTLSRKDHVLLVSDAIDCRKWDRVFIHIGPNARIHFPGAHAPLDRNAWKQMAEGLQAAFPDLHHQVEDVVDAGNRVGVRCHMEGTHQGAFEGIPATHRKVSFSAHLDLRFEGDIIVEFWVNMDVLSLMKQLMAGPAAEPKGGGNIAVVREFFDVLNRHDFEAYQAILSPNYVHHDEGVPVPHTVDAAGSVATIRQFVTAFPDLKITVDDAYAAGDKVVCRWTAVGTHTGPLGELPATGKPVTVSAIATYRFVDNKPVEGWVNSDMAGMMQQLGVIP